MLGIEDFRISGGFRVLEYSGSRSLVLLGFRV